MAVVKLNKDNLDEQIQKDIGTKMQPITKAVSKDDKKTNIVSEIFQPILGRAISDMVVTAMATISDIVIDVVDMHIYGEKRHRGSSTLIGHNYNSLYRTTATRINSPTTLLGQNLTSLYQNPSSGFRLQEVIVPTRGDAELVIDALCEKISMYGVATVGDYYDAVGIKTTAIDFKYGWVNLSSANKHRTLDGYAIILPTPKPVD